MELSVLGGHPRCYPQVPHDRYSDKSSQNRITQAKLAFEGIFKSVFEGLFTELHAKCEKAPRFYEDNAFYSLGNYTGLHLHPVSLRVHG